jgi:hypothetical protein
MQIMFSQRERLRKVYARNESNREWIDSITAGVGTENMIIRRFSDEGSDLVGGRFSRADSCVASCDDVDFAPPKGK